LLLDPEASETKSQPFESPPAPAEPLAEKPHRLEEGTPVRTPADRPATDPELSDPLWEDVLKHSAKIPQLSDSRKYSTPAERKDPDIYQDLPF
jgi:hypothetical protein